MVVAQKGDLSQRKAGQPEEKESTTSLVPFVWIGFDRHSGWVTDHLGCSRALWVRVPPGAPINGRPVMTGPEYHRSDTRNAGTESLPRLMG